MLIETLTAPWIGHTSSQINSLVLAGDVGYNQLRIRLGWTAHRVDKPIWATHEFAEDFETFSLKYSIISVKSKTDISSKEYPVHFINHIIQVTPVQGDIIRPDDTFSELLLELAFPSPSYEPSGSHLLAGVVWRFAHLLGDDGLAPEDVIRSLEPHVKKRAESKL